ncbi:MAG TPA: GH1 family beta-glucosidase [Thermoanaerobaculia bacterium]|nr:GH1 family beta-glucosidase [Thermoanaerobaculia bacterium]
MTETTPFPDGFLWGAATSAYQIEGSPLADGAGPSIWHRFTRIPGKVRDGDTADVACDHYNRYLEDVALMKSLGLGAYRFSISWSRVMPEGRGAVNQKGLDFYRRLVDALHEAGIRPMATLYHWDLPAALDDRGGWTNPDIAGWFADYARTCFRALDGAIDLWTTLNEPWVIADGGYLHGVLAPGHDSPFEAPRASKNLLLAHAAGVTAYRAEGKGQIGLVVNLEPKYPASKRLEDLSAVARADAYMNRQYLDQALLGKVPEGLADIFGEAWEGPTDAELAAMKVPVDYVGVNYYTRAVVHDDPRSFPVMEGRTLQRNTTHTETGWEVYPDGLYDVLTWVRRRYGNVPLYVTENGAAFYDPPVSPEPLLNDPLRVAYLDAHLGAVRRAIAEGVDVRGYFAWSLLDNMEWAHGYRKRFGIVHVDFATQKRTPKASARFYAEVIRTNGACLRLAGS